MRAPNDLDSYDWAMGRGGSAQRRRRLSVYAGLCVVFWTLALGPGGGGTTAVGVNATGAWINLLLLIPLWNGANWPLWPLAIEAFLIAGVIGSGGMPPDGPAFGLLTFVAAGQFLLLFSLLPAQSDDRLPL